jgi:D-glycero-D-manno-heptose 1,7-bisphosphate phosphatase
MSHRAVFLDRDGVLNEAVIRNGKPTAPWSPEELVIARGARELLGQLKGEGFLLIVVTNQPDVRRGQTSQTAVEQIHRKLSRELPLDDFFTCLHDDSDGCSCRKPLPGLLRQAAAKYEIELGSSYLIGDRWRDVDAGAAAGCRTVLIDLGYRERSSSHSPNKKVGSLAEAVHWILSQEEQSGSR